MLLPTYIRGHFFISATQNSNTALCTSPNQHLTSTFHIYKRLKHHIHSWSPAAVVIVSSWTSRTTLRGQQSPALSQRGSVSKSPLTVLRCARRFSTSPGMSGYEEATSPGAGVGGWGGSVVGWGELITCPDSPHLPHWRARLPAAHHCPSRCWQAPYCRRAPSRSS